MCHWLFIRRTVFKYSIRYLPDNVVHKSLSDLGCKLKVCNKHFIAINNNVQIKCGHCEIDLHNKQTYNVTQRKSQYFGSVLCYKCWKDGVNVDSLADCKEFWSNKIDALKYSTEKGVNYVSDLAWSRVAYRLCMLYPV